MITLSEVLAFSTKIPGIYSEVELTELYKLAVALPDHATVVEIGVLYGRSASVFFQVAQHKPLELHFIDPWVVNGEDAFGYFHRMVNEHFLAVPFTMYNRDSKSIQPTNLPFPFWILHVDGDHSPEGIEVDCDRWVWGAKAAVFHDYATRNPDGSAMYPQIKEKVDYYCRGWERVGVFDSQAIFRRN